MSPNPEIRRPRGLTFSNCITGHHRGVGVVIPPDTTHECTVATMDRTCGCWCHDPAQQDRWVIWITGLASTKDEKQAKRLMAQL